MTSGEHALCFKAAAVGFVVSAALGLFVDWAYKANFSHKDLFWGAVVGAFIVPMFVGCYDRRS